MGVSDHITLIEGDAGKYVAEAQQLRHRKLHRRDLDRRRAGRHAQADAARAQSRVVCCWSANRTGSRRRRTRLMRRWKSGKDEYTSLPGTLDRIESAGLELVEMVLADGNSWDRYVASQWWALDEWLRANPTDRRCCRAARMEYALEARLSPLRAGIFRLGRICAAGESLAIPSRVDIEHFFVYSMCN